MKTGDLNLNLRKPFYGVGINDSDYVTQPIDRSKRCPIFDVWHSMIRRCYSKNSLERNSSYEGVSVCEDWKYFSKFKTWMEKQDWQGKALDKDWLGDGTIYSPETCRFIPQDVNAFLAENKKLEIPGVRLKFTDGREKPYIAQAMVLGKKKHLGVFSNLEDGHKAWQKAKLAELIIMSRVYSEIDLDIRAQMNKILYGIREDIENNRITKSLKNFLKDGDKTLWNIANQIVQDNKKELEL